MLGIGTLSSLIVSACLGSGTFTFAMKLNLVVFVFFLLRSINQVVSTAKLFLFWKDGNDII